MIGSVIAGLSLLILGLSGTIAFELADQSAQPVGALTTPAAMPSTGSRNQAVPPQQSLDSRLSQVLARPIFSPDRRPSGSGTKNVTGLSRLTGIVVTGSRKIAIFAGPTDGHPVVAEEGSHLNAYEVKDISGSGVTVAGPAGTMVITPMFDAARPVPPRAVLSLAPKPVGPKKE